MSKILVENIGQLVTLSPLAEAQRITKIQASDIGLIDKAWLAIDAKGKVSGFGQGKPGKAFKAAKKINAQGALVLPGLVDAHTHPIFGGNRAHEFAKRLDGQTYQQIAAAGGGIKYSVKETRRAKDAELKKSTLKHLSRFLQHGVTTVEAKSGYGLNVDQEIRLLKILRACQKLTRQKIVTTCLALHAVPEEFKSVEDFVEEMTQKLLPRVKKEKLADYVDAFVENGYFTANQSEPFLAKAKELGLKIRLHADEFADSHAAQLAAKYEAASADHLQAASPAGIKAMGKAKTVAILLPGTSIYTKIPYTQAAPFKEQGCGVALATDFNPGSCQIDNLALIATLGALHCGLTVAEAIAAVCFVPAYALGLGNQKGSLAVGFDGDFSIQSLSSLEEWVADLGRHLPQEVWIQGKRVFKN